MKNIKIIVFGIAIGICNASLRGSWFEGCFQKDVILEFKAAYFRPTDCLFRDIIDNKAALFGPEVTFHINRCLYGFASADYLTKKGFSVGLHNATHVHMVPLALGLKWMHELCERGVTGYLGLGFQPTYLRTKDFSPYVCCTRSKWGFGGIAKAGIYIDVPCNFVVDLFVDYSFVSVKPFCCNEPSIGVVEPRKAKLDGVIIGGGLGYRFN